MKNIIKTPKLMAGIQSNAQQVGLDKLNDEDIEIEIAAVREAKKHLNRESKT